MSDQSNVVIIEDESAIADNLIHVLEMDGYHVEWFTTAGEGLTFLQCNSAALLVHCAGGWKRNENVIEKRFLQSSNVISQSDVFTKD